MTTLSPSSLPSSDPAGLDGRLIRVTDKRRAPDGGTLHDFFSMGPYWWPNPDTPDGLPYVRRDGHVNPEARGGTDDDRARIDLLAGALRSLVAACSVRPPADCRRRAAALLRAFFLDPASAMNPSLTFAQAIPGICAGRGIGIIDTVPLVALLDDLAALDATGAPTLSPSEDAALRAWFSAYLDWLLSSKNGLDERRAHNNHGTWMDAQLCAYARYARRPDVVRAVLAEVPARRIDTQILADGRQPFELERTRSFSYSLFNLRALVRLARFGREFGVDLLGHVAPSGGSIPKAAAFLRPYADESVPWPYPEIDPETGVAIQPSPAARATLRDLLASLDGPLVPCATAPVVRRIAELCRSRHLLFGTAESCTGGLIGACITDVPGISDVYAGGVVSYSNGVKTRLLGVPVDTLARHGAVSAETARAMAEGACRALPCGAAVAVTGIAGPGGGTPEKPVGTVYAAVHIAGRDTAVRRFDWGAESSRGSVRTRTALAALEFLAEQLGME